jgi:hypothetical protein
VFLAQDPDAQVFCYSNADIPAVRNINQRSSIGLAIPANPRGEE